VQAGETVKFPCDTNLEADVNWKRKDRFDYIYVRGVLAPGLAPRITVNRNVSNTLTIRNVTAQDSTLYRCVEDDGVGNKRFYGLTVTGETFVLSGHHQAFRILDVTGNCCGEEHVKTGVV